MAAESIDPRTAHEMAKLGDRVIDVRTRDEYERGHIAGAINIPIDHLAFSGELPDGPLITTCTMGGRAERAAEQLDRLGRTAFWIAGGTKAWQAAGLPVDVGPQP